MKIETKITEAMDRKFWKGKLEEIEKACSKSAPGGAKPASDAKVIAKIAGALQKRIPAKSVKTVCDSSELYIQFKGFAAQLKLLSYGGEMHVSYHSDHAAKLPLRYGTWKWIERLDHYIVATVCVRYCSFETIVEQIVRFCENHARYREEQQLAFVKLMKKRQLATPAIRAAVPGLVARTGCEWCLREMTDDDVLYVKMPQGLTLEICLDGDNYLDKLRDLVQVVRRTKRFLETLPYRVEVMQMNYDCVSWNK